MELLIINLVALPYLKSDFSCESFIFDAPLRIVVTSFVNLVGKPYLNRRFYVLGKALPPLLLIINLVGGLTSAVICRGSFILDVTSKIIARSCVNATPVLSIAKQLWGLLINNLVGVPYLIVIMRFHASLFYFMHPILRINVRLECEFRQ